MDINIILGHLSEWIGVIAITLLLALNTRFQKKPLVFKFPRREALYASGLYILILIFAFFFYQYVPSQTAGSSNPNLTPRFILSGISLLPFILAIRLRGQPLLSTGWNPALFKISASLGLALALLTLFLRGKFSLLLGSLNTAQWVSLPVWLGICLFEETIFRGYIQSRLCSYLHQWPGWMATALLFILWHLPRLLASPETLLFNLSFIFIQALILGWITLKNGHVIAPAIYRAVSEWLLLL